MSLGNDFLKLIEPLWDIEEYNMWNPQAHLTVAYVLDGMYGHENYNEFYRHLLKLAQIGDYNEFAMTISKATLDLYLTDPRTSEDDRNYMQETVTTQMEYYSRGQLYFLGLVNEEYAPDWFFALFGSYIRLEEIKRDNSITEFLTKRCEISEKNAEATLQKFSAHPDILQEFYFFVKNGRLKKVFPISVEGVSAKHLCETTDLSPLGAYNYLIYLRENPKEAIEDLKKGLPRE